MNIALISIEQRAKQLSRSLIESSSEGTQVLIGLRSAASRVEVAFDAPLLAAEVDENNISLKPKLLQAERVGNRFARGFLARAVERKHILTLENAIALTEENAFQLLPNR